MHEQNAEHLTLAQAVKLTPGRPHVSCLWRWCRRGIRARTGERIFLQHIRLGGRIFTTKDWLDDFGARLAEEDAIFFRSRDEQTPPPPPRRPRTRSEQERQAAIEQAQRELTEAGI